VKREHAVVARVIVALMLGGLLGYGLETSLKGDAERGKELTMKQYVADFDRHKADLEDSDMPTAVALVTGVIMVAGLFGVYELLAFGIGKGLAAITRGATDAPPGGPPPPWGLDRR
jgi:hypothetical protein